MHAFDEIFDVIVVGSGLAGLAAAKEARDAGRSAVILEKLDRYGGNSVLAGGGLASWDSSLHLGRKLGVGEDSAELMAADALRSGKGGNVPELVETLSRNAPAAIDWMMAAGVRFRQVLFHMGGQTIPRSYQCEGNGKNMMDDVRAWVLASGAELRLGHRVTDLLTDAGRIVGVRCTAGDAEKLLGARCGVILASGGFAADVALRLEYSEIGEAYNCSNHPDATGEMIRCARELGASLVNMQHIQLFPCSNPVTGSVDRWALAAYAGAGAGAIYVDGTGRRFVCELEGRDVVSDAQIGQCGKPTWAIFNDHVVETVDLSPADAARGIRLRRMVRADSFAGLAGMLGMDPDVLLRTIDEHNAFLRGEREDPFGKPRSELMRPLVDGEPVYAINQWPSVHFTMGGILTDTGARVLRSDGSVIPGLYAAGEVCGGLHGANRLAGYALTECVVFGRLAGQNAALDCSKQ